MRQAFAGMLWSKQLYYFDVARWLDGDPTQPRPPAHAADGSQLPMAQLRRLRHHVDARQMGVPVVRGMGSGLPLRGSGPRGSGLRQVPADPACAGNGSSIPTGPCPPTSGTSGMSTRPVQAWAALEVFAIDGGRRHRLSEPGLRQAPGELHLVGQPGGRRRATTSSRAASWGWTTSGRSTAPTCRWAGVLEQSDATGWMAVYALAMASHRGDAEPQRAATGGRSGPEVRRAFRRHPRGHRHPGALGRRPTASSTTGWSPRTGRSVPVKVRSMVGHHSHAGRRRGRRGR